MKPQGRVIQIFNKLYFPISRSVMLTRLPVDLTHLLSKFLVSILLTALTFNIATADEIKIWMRSFIPNKHPGNPDYILQHPTAPNKWMIRGPVDNQLAQLAASIPLKDTCFSTDHRGFNNSLDASSRVTVAFKFNPETKSVGPIETEKNVVFAGQSIAYHCETGVKIAERPGNLRSNFVGPLHVNGNDSQIYFGFAAALPYVVGSPSIDGSGDVHYNKATHELTYRFTIDDFPSFEAYAQLNNGNIVTLFQRTPSGDSVWSLLDILGATGGNAVTGNVKL